MTWLLSLDHTKWCHIYLIYWNGLVWSLNYEIWSLTTVKPVMLWGSQITLRRNTKALYLSVLVFQCSQYKCQPCKWMSLQMVPAPSHLFFSHWGYRHHMKQVISTMLFLNYLLWNSKHIIKCFFFFLWTKFGVVCYIARVTETYDMFPTQVIKPSLLHRLKP